MKKAPSKSEKTGGNGDEDENNSDSDRSESSEKSSSSRRSRKSRRSKKRKSQRSKRSSRRSSSKRKPTEKDAEKKTEACPVASKESLRFQSIRLPAPSAEFDATKPTFLDPIINKLTEMISRRPRDLRKRDCVLTKIEVGHILKQLRTLLLSQPTLVELDPPVKIVADLHGQYNDLLRLFLHCGYPPKSRYMFLGDYVDRGTFGVELFILVACLKLRYPEYIYLLRGNHECRCVNLVYGFYDEVNKKFSKNQEEMWEEFMNTFNCLPIAGLVGGKILGMHGGLSPDLTNFDQIRNIKRPCDVPSYGIMCDLLWADPEWGLCGWAESTRGISYTFGEDVVRKFCRAMKVSMIVRGHQIPDPVRKRGYRFFAGARMLTLFSAPNYCRSTHNEGAVLSVDENFGCQFQYLKPDKCIKLKYKKFPKPKSEEEDE